MEEPREGLAVCLQLAGETPQVHEPQKERISLDEVEFENMGQISVFMWIKTGYTNQDRQLRNSWLYA